MLVGLAEQQRVGPIDGVRYIKDLYERAILLAPCTVNGLPGEPSLDADSMATVGGMFELLGPERRFHSIPTDNWVDDVNDICTMFGDEHPLCQGLRAIPADTSGRMGSKLADHMTQNTLTQVFGSYVERSDWVHPYTEGLSTPWALEDVTDFPLTLVIASEDEECYPEKAYELL